MYQGLSFQYLRKLVAAQVTAFAEFARTLTTLAAQGKLLARTHSQGGWRQLRQGQEKLPQARKKDAGHSGRNSARRSGRATTANAGACRSPMTGRRSFLRQAAGAAFGNCRLEMQKSRPRSRRPGGLSRARRDFTTVAREEHDQAARAARREKNDALAAAEHFQAYRAACEKENWPAALESLLLAVQLDADKHAPLDLDKYEIVEILGAGGFGTVFRCRHINLGYEVAIKALHTTELARDLKGK